MGQRWIVMESFMLFRSRTEILFIIMRKAAVPAEREGANHLTWFFAAAHIATFECGEQPSRCQRKHFRESQRTRQGCDSHWVRTFEVLHVMLHMLQ